MSFVALPAGPSGLVMLPPDRRAPRRRDAVTPRAVLEKPPLLEATSSSLLLPWAALASPALPAGRWAA